MELMFADDFGTIDLINSTPGNYSIYINVEENGCYNSDTAVITILPECEAPQNIVVDYYNSNSIIISWDEHDFYTDYTILVILGDDTSTYYATENTFTITDLLPDTTYTIVVITNCSSSRNNAGNPIVITTAALAIEDNLGVVIQIFPNPTSGDFTIATPLLLNGCKLSIFNVEGKQVYLENQLPKQNTFLITSHQFMAGLYFIHLTDGIQTTFATIVIE
ncbi:MAG: T9SS type A sorting domain-containing protein [Chitinophagaceae bacterium]